jgi:c-di-GMP-binding flagellar brake protein YcgR
MPGRIEPAERRCTPRTEVLGRVALTVLSSPVPARLREISTGGCALETATPLPHGVHHFRLEMADREPLDVSAELVHSTRLSMQGGEGSYLAGFEFLPQSEPASRALASLVEHIAALCVS